MRSVIILYCAFVALVSLSSCKQDSKNTKSVTKAISSFKNEGSLLLLKATGDTIKKLAIEIADDAYQRQTGLMYRKTMDTEQGMLFVFPKQAPRSFYMKNTYIALDIIYINSNKKIISIQKDAQPLNENSLPSEGPAQYVLEINAGLSTTWNLDKGDAVHWIIN